MCLRSVRYDFSQSISQGQRLPNESESHGWEVGTESEPQSLVGLESSLENAFARAAHALGLIW